MGGSVPWGVCSIHLEGTLMSSHWQTDMDRHRKYIKLRLQWEEPEESEEESDDNYEPDPPDPADREFTDRDQDYWERRMGL